MTENAPTSALEWLAVGQACLGRGDKRGALAAIDNALALEPRNLKALMLKADHLAEAGDMRAAVSFYAAAARISPAAAGADMHAELKRARSMIERHARDLEAHIRAALDRQGLGEGSMPPRFARALKILMGKEKAYAQAPRYFYYPELAPIQFFERSDFPFLDQVEAAWRDIGAELDAIDAAAAEFEPYVKRDPNRAPSDQLGMAGNRAWSAYFLIKDGETTPGAARCPKTLAALAGAPLTRIPKRTPSVLFSRLTPGARIPPHTGMINARLICHLPVIAPPNCLFRVGNQTRAWEEGKAWVFDDTIEHEAWNGSDRDRTVLIFDIWRPDLHEEERLAIVALCQALDDFAGGQEWD